MKVECVKHIDLIVTYITLLEKYTYCGCLTSEPLKLLDDSIC